MSGPIQIRLSGEFQDINPIFLGVAPPDAQNCSQKILRPYTLIHYVLSGKGRFITRDREFPVQKGQLFIASPGDDSYWISDPSDPWSYRWIGFTGRFSYDFSMLPPVFDIPEEVAAIQCDPINPRFSNKAISFNVVSELALLYSIMLEPSLRNPDYAQIVMEYVQKNYAEKISVKDLAASLNLSRSYLSAYFKKKTGISIQAYILNTRLEFSKHHLLDGKSVKEASQLSGFSATSNFTKLFTREFGISPSRFRRQSTNYFETYFTDATDDTGTS